MIKYPKRTGRRRHAEEMAEMAKNLMNGLPESHVHALPASHVHAGDWVMQNTLKDMTYATGISLNDMIISRLRGREPDFPFFEAHQISSDRFVVFIVANGEPVTLEDGALFPSDNLITQIRLLIEAGK
jgi:hypothetical protein